MSGRAINRNKKVKVWARIRPTSNFAHDCLELLPDHKSINAHLKRDPKKGVVNNQILDWSFKLDGIFHNATQEHVFSTVASDMITSALDGYNATLMCYGQTGAGKTFTITGATESYRHRGMIPRALSQLYREIEERLEYSITVRISYLEIYNEAMFDLLSSISETQSQGTVEPMVVTENQDGTFVKGLTSHLAQNEEEALNLLFEGETNRAIACHALNRMSSRSHCIFTVYIESRSRVQSSAKYTVSKLNFVDLAGSERIGKSKSEGKMITEAMYINKSLSFLEQVVIALADKHREHIPFRQSKLTHYLKDSIGGNCNTVLVANIWGERPQLEETVSTLRFATRMMCVANEPAVNEVFDPALLVKKMQREINHLKAELAIHDTLDKKAPSSAKTNRNLVTYEPLSEQQRFEIRQQCRRYLEGNLDEIDVVNLRQIHGTFEAFREIYGQVEQDVEEKLRQKYAMIEKGDTAAIAAAQQAGAAAVDDGSLVGETDGSGFGVGSAPKSAKAEPSAVVQLKKKEREREKKKAVGRGSPTGIKSVTSPSQSAKGEREVKSPQASVEEQEKEVEGVPLTPASSAGAISKPEKVPRPSTPPSRTSAFEDFKQEKGSEINRILIENKEILASKKKAYSELAKKINTIKLDIDNTRKKLDRLQIEREAEGPMFNDDGDIVISEEEYLEIQKLKELKISYRCDFSDLKNLKSQIQYCQKLVDQCRQRLLNEFDKWYAESFLNEAEEEQTSLTAGHGQRLGVLLPFNPNAVPEDEGEKFDRLQLELLMSNPDSAPFYNAKIRTQRRKTYESAMSQCQPRYRRQVGTPIATLRNKPPNMLQIQY